MPASSCRDEPLAFSRQFSVTPTQALTLHGGGDVTNGRQDTTGVTMLQTAPAKEGGVFRLFACRRCQTRDVLADGKSPVGGLILMHSNASLLGVSGILQDAYQCSAWKCGRFAAVCNEMPPCFLRGLHRRQNQDLMIQGYLLLVASDGLWFCRTTLDAG